MFQVIVSKKSEKALKQMPQPDRARVFAALDELNINPLSGDVKALRGARAGSYRKRVGRWRVLFVLGADRALVLVTAIKRRTSQTYS